MSIRRTLRRMRRKDKSEEKVFERFSERFGSATSREREPWQEPREDPQREDDPQRESPRDTAPPPGPVAPPSSALRVLGLGAGASPAEVAAAYRRLARTYHPDKVAHLDQEAREFSEERMKEINAAYSEFRRPGNGIGEGARTG